MVNGSAKKPIEIDSPQAKPLINTNSPPTIEMKVYTCASEIPKKAQEDISPPMK